MNRNVRTIDHSDRLVILARTLNAPSADCESELSYKFCDSKSFGQSCIGWAQYKHHSTHIKGSSTPIWTHLELIYFHHNIPFEALRALGEQDRASSNVILRAEILLSTPESFVVPSESDGWGTPAESKTSLEFIDVDRTHLGRYRDMMTKYCGPAAQKLVRRGKFGTFRAMETAAILYQHPELSTNWNQIHLTEMNPDEFNGFGREFAMVLNEEASASEDFEETFANLSKIRTISRWTFNKAVIEADAGIAVVGKAKY